MSRWCQAYLGLQEDQLDSFWYERLAEAATAMLPFGDTSEAILEFYQKVVDLPNPRWRSYMGVGQEMFRQGNIKAAIAHVEKALELAAAPVHPPQAEPEDIVKLHLRLGDYFYKTDAFGKATEHFESAHSLCPSDNVILARKAEVSNLWVQLRTSDAQATRQLLRKTLDQGGDEAFFVSFLKDLARDDSHDVIISRIFTNVKSDRPLFDGIVHALETATTAADRSTTPEYYSESNDRFTDAEIRGVLLLDRALAAYHYRIVAPGSEPNVEAVKL